MRRVILDREGELVHGHDRMIRSRPVVAKPIDCRRARAGVAEWQTQPA